MNIFKRFNIHHLLTLPFILVPLLVTHRFQDPTLLIKRSGVFFLFAIITLILLIFKTSRNAVSSTNLKWLAGTGAFILALVVISNYNSINPSESYWELLYLSGWISIYTCFMIYSTKDTMKYIIVASSVVGAVLSLLLFNDVFHFISISLPSNGLMSATFGYRNYFGQYLCFAVPAAVISLFMLKSDKARLCMLICGIISMGGLVLTRTRAAWLGIIVSIIVFLYLERYTILSIVKSFSNNYISIAILISSIFLILYFVKIPVFDSGSKRTVWGTISTITNLKTDANWGGRLNMYRSSLRIIKEHPIIGIGLGNWRTISPKYSDNRSYRDHMKWEKKEKSRGKIRQRPHNDLLWILSEIGVVGTIFIIAFVLYHLQILYRLMKKYKNNSYEHYIFIFCLLSLIAIFIESMFDFPRQRTMPNLYLWSIMGFIASTSTQGTAKDKYQNAVPLALAAVLSVVSVFAFFDLKSNIYSQDAKYYNDNNMPKELYASSAIALGYYRNLDNAGTPMYYYMGISQYKMGNKNKAKVLFKKAMDLTPYHLGVLTNYMILLGELNDIDTAYNIMQIIEDLYPNLSKPRLDMAKFYIRKGMYKEAEIILLELKKSKTVDGKGTLNKLLKLIP